MRTTAGYAGGTLQDPDYHHLDDHSETVRVEFDSAQVSYAQLLEVFWHSHEPSVAAYSRQYRNAIFYLDEGQRKEAERSLGNLAEKTGKQIKTAIEPAGKFYPAEDYHQKYLLRRGDFLWQEFQAMYLDEQEIFDSTAAARINGYLGCNGTRDDLEVQFGQLGLSPRARQWLADYLSSTCTKFRGLTCPAPASGETGPRAGD